MTEPRKSATLSPDEWKQLALLGCVQLQNYLNGIPPVVESGASGLTVEHMAEIDRHLDRMKSLHLFGWRNSKSLQPVQQQPSTSFEQPAQANGAEPPRQKRKYTKRAKPEGVTAS